MDREGYGSLNTYVCVYVNPEVGSPFSIKLTNQPRKPINNRETATSVSSSTRFLI